jgi:hypothetical protein
MVVGAVKDIGDTRGRRNCTKKTSHIVVSGLREEMRSRIWLAALTPLCKKVTFLQVFKE